MIRINNNPVPPDEEGKPDVGFRKVRDREQIMHIFSDEEKIELGNELTAAFDLWYANKVAAKAEASRWKSTIEDNEDRVISLKSDIQNGQKEIWVDTITTYHSPARGFKTVIREDTGAELRIVEMTVDELNLPINRPDLFDEQQQPSQSPE